MSLVRVAAVTRDGQKIVLVPMRPRNGTWPPRPRGPRSGLRLALFAGGGGCCITVAAIEAGQDWSSYGGSSRNYVVIVVPDGVARVRVALSHPVTAPVHNNVAVLTVAQAVENLGIYKMTWYGPSGTVVKRFPSSLPTSTQAAATHTHLSQIDQRNTTQIAPQIHDHFDLFGSRAIGTFGRGAQRFTVAQPALTSLPNYVLDMGTGGGYPMVVKATREVTTSSGLQVWVQAGNVICMNSIPSERVGTCSSDPAFTLASGLVAFPLLPSGSRMILGVVPDTNQTVTVDTASGGTRSVPVTDGVFITPAHGVTQIRIRAITGKITTKPGWTN
jgi:hypothetical protein